MRSIYTDTDWGNILSDELLQISGEIFTARDATLKKIFDSQIKNKQNEKILKGKVLYFCGPTPPSPEEVIGSCGPTTSMRMEPFFEDLGKIGVRALIGKGELSEPAQKTLKKYNIYYFATIGGAGAFFSQKVKSAKVICFPELGAEAVYRLEVSDFPVVLLHQ